MKRVLITLFVLVAALSVASITLAQSTPAEDPKDNTCYAGGEWDGKCDWPTDAEDNWAWTCGWYYARVIDGRIGAAQAPETCKFVAEQEPVDPVDPVDPEVCDPQDDAYEFQVTTTRLSLYPYTIAAPGVLANDGACGGVDTSVRGDSNNLASILIYADGSIEVLFEGAPAYVEFTYTTTDGQTANGRIDLILTIDPIDPVECIQEDTDSICIEGNSYTITVDGIEYISVGDFNTHGTKNDCELAVQAIVGSNWQYTSYVYGTLSSYFLDSLPDDTRVVCAYFID
jgi:hypothetical protein